MLINDNSFIELKIYWRKLGHRYEAYTEKEFKDANFTEEKAKKFTVLNFKAAELTWELNNQIQDEATVENIAGDSKWNFRKYKEAKIKKILKEWDAKDPVKNQPIPINDKNIMHLAPAIAEAIIREYDEVSYLSGEEEKN